MQSKYRIVKEIGEIIISDDDIRVVMNGEEKCYENLLDVEFKFKGLRIEERMANQSLITPLSSNGADNELIIVTEKKELKKFMVILEDEEEYQKFKTILARFERNMNTQQ